MNMTIDEMIAQYKEKAKYNKMRADFSGEESYCSEQKQLAEEHEQISEWLEELKRYQSGGCMNECSHYDNCYDYIHNKAIDEFVNAVKEKFPNDRNGIVNIELIAEQLKAGGKDE